MPSSLSVVIISYNEEQNIARCIQSVYELAEEIIVVDSWSTDATKEICLRFENLKFVQQEFLGYAKQKNHAAKLATKDYILFLDADEAPNQKLLEAIQQQKARGFSSQLYSFNRLTNYCGTWIQHGSWYPDKQFRLCQRQSACWQGDILHEKLVSKTGTTAQHLKGDLLHYSYYSLEQHIAQFNSFTSIMAQGLKNRGKKAHWGKIFINPFITFLKGYIIKRGFLDGYHGFIIASYSSFATFVKYTKLKELWKQDSQTD